MAGCTSCDKPLTLFIQPDEEDDDIIEGSSAQGSTVPDDVELSCGCHFHWQCLLDAYEVTTCPQCRKDISSTNLGETQVICNVNNEGGLTTGLDILPVLSEELYLKAYPDERKPRAFLEFCREGDIEAVVDLLKASDDDESDDEEMINSTPMDNATILRYQDPVGNMRSALHFAVANKKTEVVWLLLLLASTLSLDSFPSEVQSAANQLQISRQHQSDKADIRSLQDSDGKIAAHYADQGFGSTFDISILSHY